MQVITLNVRHGGGKRIGSILAYLEQIDADVLVVTEYRNGASGTTLCHGLKALGYVHQHVPTAPLKTNSVMIASKQSMQTFAVQPTGDDSNRIIAAQIGDLVVFGVYFALNNAKASLFDFIISNTESWMKQPALLIGDFNTGLRRLDEPGATFLCADRFAKLSSTGWHDGWRAVHGAAEREASWYSRIGNGFRIDHAFVSPALLPKIAACKYDHATRPDLTDHSAMMIDLQLD